MKRAFPIALLVIICLSGNLHAEHSQHSNIGVGLVLGVPTGLSAKFWLNPRQAIDLVIGWDIQESWLTSQAGYLFHFPVDVSTGFLTPYAGLGAFAAFSPPTEVAGTGSFVAAGRIPLGLEYIYQPISFYAEINPMILVVPEVNLYFGGGAGFRFYF